MQWWVAVVSAVKSLQKMNAAAMVVTFAYQYIASVGWPIRLLCWRAEWLPSIHRHRRLWLQLHDVAPQHHLFPCLSLFSHFLYQFPAIDQSGRHVRRKEQPLRRNFPPLFLFPKTFNFESHLLCSYALHFRAFTAIRQLFVFKLHKPLFNFWRAGVCCVLRNRCGFRFFWWRCLKW